MSLNEFLHHLQFDINRANQPNWEVDWEDAPLPYKLYRGLPAIPLSTEVPLSIQSGQPLLQPDVERIGHFLWYAYGITGVSQSMYPEDSEEFDSLPIHSYRRFVPSGGALYPNELYLYLKLDDLPDGIYHYDAAHHRLVLLREGNVDSYVERALGNRCDISTCFATVFVSVRFWKNFFKYNNFSYRLQGLDTGVLMGHLLETAKEFGFQSGVYGQFLDSAINLLLGLTEEEESVYAVIPLSVAATNWSGTGKVREREFTTDELCREMPALSVEHYERSEKLREFPMLLRVNEASHMHTTGVFRTFGKSSVLKSGENEILLPEMESLPYDFVDACKNRHSPEMDFVMGKVSQQQLSALLKRATHSFSHRSDVDDIFNGEKSRVSIYVCLYNVEGIPNGAYVYDSARHSLRQIGTGDYRLQLQSGLSLDNVNLLQVPLCLHIIGNKSHFQEIYGYRGYRMMQMEAGMLVQPLLLASSAVGFGGHPLLGIDTKLTDGIYKLDSESLTTLIQIPIGPFREKAWMRGSLMS
ncbi:SagB family peptide dehydrogenase [Rossellomorea aquimaris]|uniref:SagB/ThcOx family dehydrogenase n=1 Tax=Rossellomorea aquimaris TaxID=189382 RepID=UPI001CD2E475|nr:SagB family peptide dehydrogenase [Rossellomorea aquimaris]MCA1057586.1 SagB family peptide dehydrogenase [Rossellomorea aquimaris]